MNRLTDNAVPATGPATGGRAPGGMWRAAWRLHRRTVVATVVAAAVLLGVMVAFRLTFDAAARDHLGTAYQAWTADGRCPASFSTEILPGFDWWRTFQLVMVLVPVAAGVLTGVSAVSREINQRTTVFALTQSVGRLHWWATTLTVTGLPLIALMIPTGYVMQWASHAHPRFSSRLFDLPAFAVFGFMPAVLALVGLSIGALAGVSVRGSLPASVSG